ncbi:hypothetical protein JHK87_024767 [Glycine soja]|nr:hypothetical protein JHK87_024767 [Glycine soja]
MQTLVQGFVNVGVGVFLVCDLKEERGLLLWLCWRRRRRRFGEFGGEERTSTICSAISVKVALCIRYDLVGCLIEHDNKVLLCKRSIQPSQLGPFLLVIWKLESLLWKCFGGRVGFVREMMGNEYCNQIIFSLNTTTLHYIIPYAIGASASTRILNELGAANPKAAQGQIDLQVHKVVDACKNALRGLHNNKITERELDRVSY